MITPAGASNHGYSAAPHKEAPPQRLEDAATAALVQRVAETLNEMLQGRLNVVLPVTLDANAATTTMIDVRIGAFASLLFSPVTAHAAAELGAGTLYVSSQQSGQATLTHANNAQTDRSFNVAILG